MLASVTLCPANLNAADASRGAAGTECLRETGINFRLMGKMPSESDGIAYSRHKIAPDGGRVTRRARIWTGRKRLP